MGVHAVSICCIWQGIVYLRNLDPDWELLLQALFRQSGVLHKGIDKVHNIPFTLHRIRGLLVVHIISFGLHGIRGLLVVHQA